MKRPAVCARIGLVGMILLIWGGAGPGRAQELPVKPAVYALDCAAQEARAQAEKWNLDFGPGVHVECDARLIRPIRIREVKPQYTPEAMRAKIQGKVTIGAVVDADGIVRQARVLNSLDSVFGLDEQAVKAVQATQFLPGKLNGQPVRVFVFFDLQFTLR